MAYVKQGNIWRWQDDPKAGLPAVPKDGIRVMSGLQRLQYGGIDPNTAREGDPGLSRQQNAALSALGRSDEAALYENNGGQYGSALTDALQGRVPRPTVPTEGRQLVQGGTVAPKRPMQTGVQPGQSVYMGGQPSIFAFDPTQATSSVAAQQPVQTASPAQTPASQVPTQGPASQVPTQGPASQVPQTPASQVPSFGPAQTGLRGAESALQTGLGGAMSAVQGGVNQARSDLTQAGAGANQTLSPFYGSGAGANDYQAALSGALGGDAQSQAMARFQNSPGQQYLLDESERAIRRNAAATGGLGGANVQRALQENAIGLAAQDFDNAFNRLGSVSDRGLAAGGQMSNNTMATGQNLAGVSQDAMGLNANMIYGTGNNIAAGRTRAGEMIAGNIEQGSANLADIISRTGDGMSSTIGDGAANLATTLRQSGLDDAQIIQILAEMLSGNSISLGNQVGGSPGLGGAPQNEGILSSVGDFASGIGALMASDARLKTNIQKIGSVSGVNIYSWDWNDEGRRIAGNQSTVGVLAQEVPHASVMFDDGYYRVDYARVW